MCGWSIGLRLDRRLHRVGWLAGSKCSLAVRHRVGRVAGASCTKKEKHGMRMKGLEMLRQEPQLQFCQTINVSFPILQNGPTFYQQRLFTSTSNYMYSELHNVLNVYIFLTLMCHYLMLKGAFLQ